MSLTREDRTRIIRARMATYTAKQITYFKTKTKNQLKKGWITQDTHDMIINMITKRKKEASG